MSVTHAASFWRRLLVAVLSVAIASPPLWARAQQQPAPKKLKIIIVEGEGAINNVRQRTAREPIVQVVDENNRPVAGATVMFLLPESGPGGTFPDGARSLIVTTDRQGRAVAKGFRANAETGKFQIQVEATYRDLVANATINQANAVLTAGAAAGAGAAGGISGKVIAILAIAGAAVAGGVIAATSGGNGGGGGAPPAPPRTVITPGTPSVGAPGNP